MTIEARGDCDPRNLGKVIPKDSGASRITFILGWHIKNSDLSRDWHQLYLYLFLIITNVGQASSLVAPLSKERNT